PARRDRDTARDARGDWTRILHPGATRAQSGAGRGAPSGVARPIRGCRLRYVRPMKKRDHPVDDVRRFLEPGPIVLVSSAWKSKTNIMTMGWHMVMSEEPALVGCFIWDRNHSFEMIRKSRECVINVPTVDLATTVVRIGNTSGAKVDKFERFGLTAVRGREVKAPLIDECHANFECRLVDSR